MAGEHVVVRQGRLGSDVTHIVQLNDSGLYLWQSLKNGDFDTDKVADLLVGRYGLDRDTAVRDASAWIDKLRECELIEE